MKRFTEGTGKASKQFFLLSLSSFSISLSRSLPFPSLLLLFLYVAISPSLFLSPFSFLFLSHCFSFTPSHFLYLLDSFRSLLSISHSFFNSSFLLYNPSIPPCLSLLHYLSCLLFLSFTLLSLLHYLSCLLLFLSFTLLSLLHYLHTSFSLSLPPFFLSISPPPPEGLRLHLQEC